MLQLYQCLVLSITIADGEHTCMWNMKKGPMFSHLTFWSMV